MSLIKILNKKFNVEKASAYPTMYGYLVFKDNTKIDLNGGDKDFVKVMTAFKDGKNPVKSLTTGGSDVPEDEANVAITMDGKQIGLDSVKEVNEFLSSIASEKAAVKKEPKLKMPKTEKELNTVLKDKTKRLKQNEKLLTSAKKKMKLLEKELRDLDNLVADIDEDIYQLVNLKKQFKKKSKK